MLSPGWSSSGRWPIPVGTGYAVTPDAWRTIVGEAGAHQMPDISCPVHLVGGTFDQLAIDIRWYARASRDARIVVVPGATHLLPFTHRRALASVIAEASGVAVRG